MRKLALSCLIIVATSSLVCAQSADKNKKGLSLHAADASGYKIAFEDNKPAAVEFMNAAFTTYGHLEQ